MNCMVSKIFFDIYIYIYFMWVTVKGRLLTTDNLQKRGFVIPIWCSMCKSDEETVDHLFLHCRVARELWDSPFCLLDMNWVMSGWVSNLFLSWAGLPVKKN